MAIDEFEDALNVDLIVRAHQVGAMTVTHAQYSMRHSQQHVSFVNLQLFLIRSKNLYLHSHVPFPDDLSRSSEIPHYAYMPF